MTARSNIAAWCRGCDCTLNGELAVITGWCNQFATISTLGSNPVRLTGEWSWDAVHRVMSSGRKFTL